MHFELIFMQIERDKHNLFFYMYLFNYLNTGFFFKAICFPMYVLKKTLLGLEN